MKKIEEIDMENDREQLQSLIINETTDNLKYLDNVLDISLFLENIGIKINSNEIEQKENAELKKQVEELKATNKVLSNELTKNSILKQDCLTTLCGIPIYDIPKIKEENEELKQELKVKDKALELYQIIFKFNNGSRSTKEVLEAVRYIETDFNPKTSRLFVDKEKDIQFMLEQAEMKLKE